MERIDDMIGRYGEVCSQTKAAHILDRSAKTIRQMLDDGRLKRACQGSKVDVRSILAYIEAPAEIEYEARLNKRRAREGVNCKWRVI